MANTESAKLVGRVAGILALLGVVGFFAGVFGLAPRTVMLVGIAMIVVSLVAFFVEEFQLRGRF